MQRVIGIGLLCVWMGTGCTPPREQPAPAPPKVRAQAVGAEETHDPATNSAPTRFVATNEVPPKQTVPDNVLAQIIARFPFDVDAESDPASGSALPGMFKRESPAYGASQLFDINQPRLVKGKFGKGLLLEESHANLWSRNQAAVEGTTTNSFISLKSTALSFTTNEHWQGKQSLKVEAPGANGAEGVAIETIVAKALYDGKQIGPVHYVASVYLKGSGSLMLSLKEPGAGTETEPVVVALDQKWRRFFCTYPAAFPAKTIGPGHAADWQNHLPPEPALEVKLLLVCSTIDKQKMTFYADGFQLEQRLLPFAAQDPGCSPRSWTPGGTSAAQDEFSFATESGYFTAWKKNGAISFWFKPNWDARDGTQELLLYLGPALMYFQHVNTKLRFQPAGVEFKPYDWKDNWHHIAMTWDEAGSRVLYVDGYDYVNAQGETSPLPDATDVLELSHIGNGNSPNGIVDELILFQGALNLDQIKAIAAYEPVKPPEPGTPEEQPSTSEPPAATNIDMLKGASISNIIGHGSAGITKATAH